MQRVSVSFVDRRGDLHEVSSRLVAIDASLDLAVWELQDNETELTPITACLQ